MEAQDLEHLYDANGSPVRSATQYFEDAYNALIFGKSDSMQGIEINDSTDSLHPETSNYVNPVNELGSPGLNFRELDHQNEATQQRRVKPELSQTSASQPTTRVEDALTDEDPVILAVSKSVSGRLDHIPQYRENLHGQTASTPNVKPWKTLDVKPKGEVRFHPDGMDYRENATGEWLPAVYHYQLRQQYVSESIPSHREYRFPDPQGRDAFDITTYHPDNKDWGPAWPNRPQILQRFARDGYSGPDYEPEVLTDRGRVVIDQENHTVKAWRELPLCISSKVPGYKMEAWRRLNPRLTIPDFMARMVKTERQHLSDRNKLSMRMTRFRLKGACISWIEREGCLAIRDYMSKLIGPACVAANSTAAFGRDLTDAEIAEVLAVNKGKHPERRRWKAKLEDMGREPGSKEHPVVLGSDDEEGKDDLGTNEEGAHAQALVPKRETTIAPPPVRPAAYLTEASRTNEQTSEIMPQRQQLRDIRRHMHATPQSSSRAVPYNAVGSSTIHRPPQITQLSRYRRYGDDAADFLRADPRFNAPRNEAEAASIQRALQFTRDDFILNYSEEAPLTDHRQCYASQWQELRIAFWHRWLFPGAPPRLTVINVWGDTVMEWRPPMRDDGQRNP